MTYLKSTYLPVLSLASALLLSACGGGGSSGGTTTTPPPPPPAADTTAPAVSFSPTTLSVESESTGTSTLTATDAVGITNGPNVTCTNGGDFDVTTNIFTAAAVTVDTQSICTATASDAAGNQGTATLTVTMTAIVPDTEAPTVTFNPGTLTVFSGATGTATLTATDNIAVTTGPTVTCTNGGSFDVATNTFTAPDVDTETASVCTATAIDEAGNEGTATLTVTITPPPPDTTAPTVTFNPNTLIVQSGETGSSTLTVTDDVAVTTGPTVTCTNGGSFDVATNTFTAATVTENTESICTATASDEAGNEGIGSLTVTMTPAPVAGSVTLSGTLTYDRVPLNTNTNGLNFNAIVQMPIRQAPVELLDASGAVIESTVSDDSGAYSFDVLSGTEVRVRVRSEVQQSAPNLIDMQVLDNTSGNSIYAIQGALEEVPNGGQTRDLNADSGWGGSSYTGQRAAAPFALLDTILGTLEDFIEVDSSVGFPAFDILWSTRNRSENGNVADGQIGTSSFTVANGIPVIRILGDENADTDEFDVHVVVHEFGHYFENQLSRADSIGGPHTLSDRLDPRVAFGEGWGNALSGMILDDPFYRDSSGNQQSTGFSFNVESNTFVSTGWFSEASVQSILYDLFDDDDDGADTASFGLGPIYGAFTDPAYTNTEAFTTIFAFLEALDNQSGISTAEITALTDAQNINGSTSFAVGETNNGGISDTLPVYLPLPVNGTPVEFCSFNNFGTFNKLGNRRFLEFEIPTAGAYRIQMSRDASAASDNGPATSDPDFIIFSSGTPITGGQSPANNVETQTVNLPAGQLIMDAHAFENVDFVDGRSTPADFCFTLTLEAQ